MAATYVDKMGNVLQPQAPRNQTRAALVSPSVPQPAAKSDVNVLAVTVRDLPGVLADATPEWVAEALTIEKAVAKPRRTVIEMLNDWTPTTASDSPASIASGTGQN